MFGWDDFSAIDREQDVAGFNAGDCGGAPRVNILKDPALPMRGLIIKVCCAKRSAAGCAARARVEEAEM